MITKTVMRKRGEEAQDEKGQGAVLGEASKTATQAGLGLLRTVAHTTGA